eukprot:GGOE01036745.1.p1 GENE.GGOE01036745.1~~GGOE01036745.1.p1  ORF type:complete len:349 (+),score=83.64 GGOE01036745.1:61-1107(+)
MELSAAGGPTHRCRAAWAELSANVMEFVFPDEVTHPTSAARLYAWAAYGPAIPNTVPPALQAKTVAGQGRPTGAGLDLRAPGSLTLRGGNTETSPLILKHELRLLLSDAAKQFVLDVYCTKRPDLIPAVGTTITDRDYETILQRAPPELARALEYSVDEVQALAVRAWTRSEKEASKTVRNTGRLSPSGTPLVSSKGTTPQLDISKTFEAESLAAKKERELMFSIFSDVILRERQRRVRALQWSVVSLHDVRTDPMVLRPKQLKIYNKTHKRPYQISDWESPIDVARSLHRSSAAVISIDMQHRTTADVVQNVRLIRDDAPYREGHTQEGWDNFCCLRKVAPVTKRIL